MLRLKGKPRQLIDPYTKKLVWSPYPLTQEEGYREKLAKYWPMTPCPVHGDKSVHFTATGIAACCAHHDAAAAYNQAVLVRGEPKSITEATAQGVDYYWSPETNPYCGHNGKRTLAGQCWFCKDERVNSPRQLALASKAIWYTPPPTDLCNRGHHARRRVSNGSCEQCEQEARHRQPQATPDAPQQLHEAFPEMVISRADAKAGGMLVFRTGRPCKKGHTGWRYVSTGCCLDCKKEW